MPASHDIKVRIIDGGQKATIEIPAGLDAAAITPAMLREIASAAGVRVTPAVEARISAVIGEYGDAAREISVELARATPPQKGHAGTWVWQPRFDPGAAALADGPGGDPASPKILIASAGEQVATYTPPGDGVDGQTVTGGIIPSAAGKAAAIRPGDGLTLAAGGAVNATQDGALWVVKGLAQISPLREVKGSVDVSAGPITVKGDLLIKGSVRDGVKIHASGNVFVEGSIEGAEIVSGGQFVCAAGVSSKRRAKVVVGGPAALGPIRNMAAVFRSHLTCRDLLESCDITVGGEFHGETATMAGGSLTLTGDAFIGTLGSPQAALTTLHLGELPLLNLELKRLTGEISRLQGAITEKDEAALTLQCTGAGNSAHTREQLTEIQYERSGLARQLAAHEAERARLQQAFSRGRSCKVQVGRAVLPKVRLHHPANAYEFERELAGPVQIIVSTTGEMQVWFPNQEPRPIAEFATLIRSEPARKSA